MAVSAQTLLSSVEPLTLAYDRERLEDVGFMTCMTLVLLGNYAQTGHFGGPLAYTPYNVAVHLAGPDLGGLRYDYRRPKHPFGDKFMLAGGHSIPTCYALWMIMGEALARKYKATGDKRYYVDPHVAMLPIDALGFRRGAGALATLLAGTRPGRSSAVRASQRYAASARWRVTPKAPTSPTTSTADHPASASPPPPAKPRSGIWLGASMSGPKIIAFEGEFAMTEGHAQELKTQALALQVGKRLRVMLSDNNAGIDDSLLGGVIACEVRPLPPGRSVDLLRLERLHPRRRQRLRPGCRGAQNHGGLGSQRPPSHDRHRQDHQGLLAARVARKDLRDTAISWSATRAIPTRRR